MQNDDFKALSPRGFEDNPSANAPLESNFPFEAAQDYSSPNVSPTNNTPEIDVNGNAHPFALSGIPDMQGEIRQGSFALRAIAQDQVERFGQDKM